MSEMSSRSIQIRLFITCWMVFVLHFATDFVREHYMVLSIVEDGSFRLDKYVGLHYDIFETPEHGAHFAANPGASMIAAVPYFVFRPVVDRIVAFTSARRSGQQPTGEYRNPIAARVEFYKKVRERGLDIKFGLVGLVTMITCMAPLTAWSAVVMFGALGRLGLSNRLSLGMSLLYAFGTPIFFRTAYLNHNLMLGIFSFMAFTLLWQSPDYSRRKTLLAGFLGGLAFLCDYSGLIPLLFLGIYAFLKRKDSTSTGQAFKDSMWYAVGAIGPVGLLWLYQWSSFGNPFYPPQRYMPAVNQYVQVGYHGFGLPDPKLLWMLLFDARVGLFVAAPILLLAFFAPLLSRSGKNLIPFRETVFIFALFVSFVLFFSFVQYTRLQWITGIRYLVPVIPFLFLLVVTVLLRMPRIVMYVLSAITVAQAWSMAMVRSDEGVSVFDSIVGVFSGGLQLPWMNTLSRMPQYTRFLPGGTSPLPFFLLWAVLIYGVWRWNTTKPQRAQT